MKKPLIITLVAICVFVLGLFSYWFILRHSESKKTTIVTKQDVVTESRKILDQIGSLTDYRGFYGSGQSCNPDGHNCTIYNMLDGDLAGFRGTIPIIWARFKYYQATGDESQLKALEQDIDHLIDEILAYPELWELQTYFYNCALMKELIESPLITIDYQQKAKRICNESIFEYHPESIVAYDQHQHAPYYFQEESPIRTKAWQATVPESRWYLEVIWDEEPKGNQTFTEDELASQIAAKVQFLIGNTNSDGIVSTSRMSEDFTDVFNFIVRENAAALDQAKAAEINADNPALAAENRLHFLLLLNETLDWYTAAPDNAFRQTDGCMIRANLTYFAKIYPQYLSQQDLKQVQDKLPDRDSYNKSAHCAMANYLVGLPTNTIQQYNDTIKRLNPQQWQQGGILYSTTGDFDSSVIDDWRYDNIINAFYAGLLIDNSSKD